MLVIHSVCRRVSQLSSVRPSRTGRKSDRQAKPVTMMQ